MIDEPLTGFSVQEMVDGVEVLVIRTDEGAAVVGLRRELGGDGTERHDADARRSNRPVWRGPTVLKKRATVTGRPRSRW